MRRMARSVALLEAVFFERYSGWIEYSDSAMPPIDIHALDGDLLLRGVWEGLGRPECHLTGGYLRDRLLGRKNSDLDLVLPGTIEQTRASASRLAARLDTRAHVLGHGPKRVWRIESTDLTIELWPLGRMQPEKDIARRDFTVNALVYPLPAGPLADRVGGLRDLEHGILRALAESNLHKDPVRLLRGPRFLAQLEGFAIEPTTATWIRSLAPLLAGSAKERVGQELKKLVSGKRASMGLDQLLELDLLIPSAPTGPVCDPEWITRNRGAVDRLTGGAPHPVPGALREAGLAARLAPLVKAWGTPEDRDLAPYAWDKGTRRHARLAAASTQETIAEAKYACSDRRQAIHRTGTAFPAVLAVAAALEPGLPWRRWWRLWKDRGSELIDPNPLLSGREIAEITGHRPGPELGRVVEELVRAQLRAEVRTRGGAVRWLRRRSSS